MENLSNLLLKLSRSLFVDTAEQENFIQAITNPQRFNPAILWLQSKPTEYLFNIVVSPGYFAYMTCTYSSSENEQVSEWLLSKFQEYQPVTVPHLEKDRSHLTEIPCYRMWSQDKLGAGAFTVLFQNTSEGETNPLPADFLDLARFTL